MLEVIVMVAHDLLPSLKTLIKELKHTMFFSHGGKPCRGEYFACQDNGLPQIFNFILSLNYEKLLINRKVVV